MVKVYNAKNIIEADKVAAILKVHGITAVCENSRNDITAYGTSGFGLHGVDVYVVRDDYDRAVNVLEQVVEKLL